MVPACLPYDALRSLRIDFRIRGWFWMLKAWLFGHAFVVFGNRTPGVNVWRRTGKAVLGDGVRRSEAGGEREVDSCLPVFWSVDLLVFWSADLPICQSANLPICQSVVRRQD